MYTLYSDCNYELREETYVVLLMGWDAATVLERGDWVKLVRPGDVVRDYTSLIEIQRCELYHGPIADINVLFPNGLILATICGIVEASQRLARGESICVVQFRPIGKLMKCRDDREEREPERVGAFVGAEFDIAMGEFRAWNDVTGVIDEGSSYLGEMESVIEDAVEIGKLAGLGVPMDKIRAEFRRRRDS